MVTMMLQGSKDARRPLPARGTVRCTNVWTMTRIEMSMKNEMSMKIHVLQTKSRTPRGWSSGEWCTFYVCPVYFHSVRWTPASQPAFVRREFLFIQFFRIFRYPSFRTFSWTHFSFSSRMYTAFVNVLTGPTGVSFHSSFQNFPVSYVSTNLLSMFMLESRLLIWSDAPERIPCRIRFVPTSHVLLWLY